jgi:NADH/NAD ratio-sensing transcriptional regulator Rex
MAMTQHACAPESSVLRLSRYHCFLGELRYSGGDGCITSREIAQELGVSDETVRRDLAFVQVQGRPGAGYDIEGLYQALCGFLALSVSQPFVAIGNADVLRGLAVTFPAEQFGMRAAAFFSERPEDVGAAVSGESVHALERIPEVVGGLGVTIALVACTPTAVGVTLDLLSRAGVHGIVMLTPVLRPAHPEGMTITYFRMPCALKSLVSDHSQACSCAAE